MKLKFKRLFEFILVFAPTKSHDGLKMRKLRDNTKAKFQCWKAILWEKARFLYDQK